MNDPNPSPSFASGAQPSRQSDGEDVFPIIEGYDIIDLIGRGGMGAVFEAFQQSTGRRVAVKLMLERAGATETARRRFEREVELVARLNHPNIVSILDSGIHRGRYFYVMEFVEGKPLDHAFASGECDVKASLAAIAKIARAVEYAHQRGVMHRDLKPSNILVDASGEPHLLDFGLAKAFDPNSLVQMRHSLSEPGQIIGTLGYMAPEQARGEMAAVSVRSDVYALGAIAYEVVTGRLPCPIDGPMAIVFQRIEARDPERPSSIRKGVPLDIDAVLLKSLEKSPDKRYATAGAFAEDIEHYLGDRPVSARHVGALVRSGRWCRRNPAGAGIIATLAVLVVVMGASAWITSRKERERAEKAESLAAAMDAPMAAFETVGPDSDIKAPVVFADKYTEQLGRIKLEPATEAKLRERMGNIYRTYGELKKAEEQYEKSLDIRRDTSNGPSEELARSLRNLGALFYDRRDLTRAETLYREALAMRQSLAAGKDSLEVSDSLNHLAATLARLHKFDEAQVLFEQMLAMRERLLGAESQQYAAALNNYGTFLYEKGDILQAEVALRRALDIFRASAGKDDHTYLARGLRSLAGCLRAQGRLDEVEDLLNETLRIRIAKLGNDHPEVAMSLHELGSLAIDRGDGAKAESLLRQALDIREQRLPYGHSDTGASWIVFARALLLDGKVSEAEAAAVKGLEIRERAKPRLSAEIAEGRSVLGAAYLELGRYDESISMLQESLTVLERERGLRDNRTRRCIEWLASALRKSGNAAAADEVVSRTSTKPAP